MPASGSGAVRLAQQAFGKLARPSGRDDISLAFEEHRGASAQSCGVRRNSGQFPDLGGVQQSVALQVKVIRGLDEPYRRREQ